MRMCTSRTLQDFRLATLLLLVMSVAHVPPALAQASLPSPRGILNGTGTYFEVTNSDYLNVTVISTAAINLHLNSFPTIVDMTIDAASGATSSEVTLGGLMASTTYWMYQDTGIDGSKFTTDATGRHSFTLDLLERRHIRIQPGPSTIHILDDGPAGTGSQCTSVGTWSALTKTCRLTQDVNESILIDSSGVTLDGAGHQVNLPSSGFVQVVGNNHIVTNLRINGMILPAGSPSGYGIYLYNGNNTRVTNVTVSNTYYGIYSYSVRNSIISENTVSGVAVGAVIYGAFYNKPLCNSGNQNHCGSAGNTLSHNTLSPRSASYNFYGVYLIDAARNNTIVGNTISDFRYGLYVPDSYCQINSGYCQNGNAVYRNNFINSVSRQIFAGGFSTTVYNLAAPEGGNYYSNFHTPTQGCDDVDSDGFCDDPYGLDNLPRTTQVLANQPPTTSAGGPYSGQEGSALLMGATASDPDDDALTYAWSVNSALCTFSDPIALTPNLTCTDNGSVTVTLNTSDGVNPTVTSTANVTVQNVAPIVMAMGVYPATLDENATVTISGNFTDGGTSDTHAASISWGDGAATVATVIHGTGGGTFAATHHYLDDNPTGTAADLKAITATVADDDGSAGHLTTSVTINNVAPVITGIIVPRRAQPLGTVNVSARFTDVGAQDMHVCTIDWDDGVGPVAATAGSGTCTGAHDFTEAGVYAVTVQVTDDDTGMASLPATDLIIVYDPTAGYVSGGGWYDSLPGADRGNQAANGKTTFGFSARYKNGASVPHGQTEVRLAGTLSFHGTSSEWLVVTDGCMAQYKGVGTVNGMTGYNFVLTLRDGELCDSPTVDGVRIEIIGPDGLRRYDTRFGDSDDISPNSGAVQAIGGGSIKIHTR